MSELSLKNVSVSFDMQSAEGRKNSVLSRYFIVNKTKKLSALQGINLKFSDGDRIGLIGSNGAGKSTLLRVLSGILPPSAGQREVDGEILPLIKGSIALMQQASISQNIKLQGLKLGLAGTELRSYSETVRKQIALDDFIHAPIMTLSEGMKNKVRLGLSSLRTGSHDIVLMDEWIGVMDKRILHKGSNLINLIEKSNIFVFASHNRQLLRALCDEAIFMENGKIKARLPVEEAIEKHL